MFRIYNNFHCKWLYVQHFHYKWLYVRYKTYIEPVTVVTTNYFSYVLIHFLGHYSKVTSPLLAYLIVISWYHRYIILVVFLINRFIIFLYRAPFWVEVVQRAILSGKFCTERHNMCIYIRIIVKNILWSFVYSKYLCCIIVARLVRSMV